jgi:hypothetical protein
MESFSEKTHTSCFLALTESPQQGEAAGLLLEKVYLEED